MLRDCIVSLLATLLPPRRDKGLAKQKKKLRKWRKRFAYFLHSEDLGKRNDATENVGGKRAASALDKGGPNEQRTVKNHHDDSILNVHAGVCALASSFIFWSFISSWWHARQEVKKTTTTLLGTFDNLANLYLDHKS